MKIIECPRDAMQGIKQQIPTALKVKYINSLLKVGFDTIDFGSFVSPKAIPQMADTAEVLAQLDLSATTSKLLAIVANVRGAETACDFEEIQYLGFPLSLSETFQQRNTNRSIDTAFDNLAEIQEICQMDDKTLVVYLSMGFGNPYGDPYEVNYVGEFVERLDGLEIGVISLADTIGVAEPKIISELFTALIPKFPHVEFGAHLHSTPAAAAEKVQAAYASGCRRIDGALKGFGGCPMAKDELTGNMATEQIIASLEEENVQLGLDMEALNRSFAIANEVFTIGNV
ncbi:hydroxymethylglutaryl-CoA lyase [Marinoscillum furvescens]|uniref:Hydroxymethylglutaryl-CoA lyase n=1 Tax=Marinoscillum furvescens DSM 4134 TaxID=1122208 RepID=A0A3D9L0C1_MARFU|nr:hydroxymethylglutaryl-CoA lyase [Marinoscillum furvescens]RED95603.1 hydroxymethylglutaryl-CoA lyase [Marinoscillum furvescens DSM 4134]